MELLLTVLALLAAIYALVPRVRQLDLQLRLGLFDKFVMVVATAAVLYLEFNNFFSAKGWVLSGRWPQGITPTNSIYLVLLGTVGVLFFRIRFAHLSRRKMRKFKELIEELYWAESYAELLALLQKHLAQLFTIARSKTLWSRLRTKLEPAPWPQLTVEDLQDLKGEFGLRTDARARGCAPDRFLASFYHIRQQLRELLLKLLTKNDTAQQNALELVRTILLSPRLMKALVRTRPYLGLDIIRQWTGFYGCVDFISLYLTELLRDPLSVLYQELAENRNILASHRYIIPESNRIIHFFLSDAAFANQVGVYKPVGDYAESYLDDLARDPENDPYNRAMGDFKESGAWNSALHATIRFFDIMVEEALHQGVEWHMWLYYMPPIVERIARNYRLIDPLADADREWPIRYNYLLYEIFSALRSWIESVEDVPLDQSNVELRSTRADIENGNIPKSSILALCECMRIVLESSNLNDRSKRDLTDMVFIQFLELRSNQKLQGYATVLRNAISQGGTFRRRNDTKYRTALIAVFEQKKNEYLKYLIKNPEDIVTELEAALQ